MKIPVPMRLLKEVEPLGLTDHMNEYMLKLIGSALYHYEVGDSTAEEYYLKWSAEYIKKVTSDDFYALYRKRFGVLSNLPMEDRILQTDGIFHPKKGKCLFYRLNPSMLQGETKVVDIKLDVEENSLNHLFPDIIKNYVRICSKLQVNDKELLHNLEFIISPVLRQEGDVNVILKDKHEASDVSLDVVEQRQFKKVAFDNGEQYFNGKKNIGYLRAIQSSEEHIGSDIVIREGQAFIGDKGKFFAKTVQTLREVARKRIYAARSADKYCLISSSNGRMNSYITNLNTAFLPFISIDGKMLESWDLRSSQPTIVANLLSGNEVFLDSLRSSPYKKLGKYLNSIEDHVKRKIWEPFLNALLNSDIYAELAEKLNISREQAKHKFMVALFRKDHIMTDIHRALDTQYPGTGIELIELKKTLKKTFPNEKSPLALFLQMAEAHIFVEGVLGRFTNMELLVFSRHDSILFPSTQENNIKVFRAMNEHFEAIGFQGKLKSFTYWVHPEYDPPYLVDKDFLYSQEEYWEWDWEEAEKQKEFERRFHEAHGL